MKRAAGLSLCVLASTWAFGAVAATPSVNGSNIFAKSSIIDDEGGVWKIVSGVVERNGSSVGRNFDANMLLEYDGVFYHRNTSNSWFAWSNSSWHATSDPRVISANDARVGEGNDVLIDSHQHVWTLPSDLHGYRDGIWVDGNYNTIALVYHDEVIYCENTGNEWYAWSGSAWTRVAGDPATSSTKTVSANGASISVGSGNLVDSGGNVWTLQSDEWAYRNGKRAATNYNTVEVLWYGGVIYSENTSGQWYAWTGSAWKHTGDPDGAAPPVTPPVTPPPPVKKPPVTPPVTSPPVVTPPVTPPPVKPPVTPPVTPPPVSSDPRGPSIVQYALHNSGVCPGSNPGCTAPFEVNSNVSFTKVTTKGDAIWVAATVADFGGVHVISVTDSQNNVYHELNQENDKRPGWQTVAHFYAGNIAGGSDTITVHWGNDNYKAIVATEIAGVQGSPLLGSGSQIQDGQLSAGADNVNGEGVAVSPGTTTALIVALTMDTDGGNSDLGGTGSCAVPAGSGFTQVAQFWNWAASGQPACNLATLETKTVSGTNQVVGSFTSSHLGDPYVSVTAVFH